jgi:LacI family transcriptional regulator
MAPRGRRSDVGVMDIAHDLGVSTATVSRALNGSSAVRPDLARRIREYAEQLGYVPNRLARALSANTSRAFVGFVIPYVDTPAYSAVAAKCARLLSADGTQMILTITENDPQRELNQLRELVASRVAGLVISPSAGTLDQTKELLQQLPVVELHRACGIEAPGVFTDDEQTMTDAILHLATLGHRDIAYLGTPEVLSHGAARLRGVRRGMTLGGLDPDSLSFDLVEPTPENGRLGTARLLSASRLPTALLVGGGSLSIAAATEIRARGLRLPDDFSLIAYGDPDWFSLSDPPLTTISVPYDDLAEHAAQLLLDRLDSPRKSVGDGATLRQYLKPELRLAGSTGPPPTRTS